MLCLQNLGLISENKIIEVFANIELKSCSPNVIIQIKLNFQIGNCQNWEIHEVQKLVSGSVGP